MQLMQIYHTLFRKGMDESDIEMKHYYDTPKLADVFKS